MIGQAQLHQCSRRSFVRPLFFQKDECLLIVVDRLPVGVQTACQVTGLQQVINRPLSLAGLDVVARQLHRDLVGAPRVQLLQQGRDLAVQQPSFAEAEPIV